MCENALPVEQRMGNGIMGTIRHAVWKIYKFLEEESCEKMWRALCANTLAIDSFISYVQSDNCSRVTGIDIRSYLFDDLNFDTGSLREIFMAATILPKSAFTSSDRSMFDIVEALVLYYLDSPFFNEWYQIMVSDAAVYLSKPSICTETTYPDLPVIQATKTVLYNTQAEYLNNLVINAQTEYLVGDAEVETMTAVVAEPSFSTMKAVFDSCDPIEWPKLVIVMREHNWVAILMVALETMPISLTVSVFNHNSSMCAPQGSPERRPEDTLQCPLVYVNKHFESLCRSTRDCVVGMSLTFMQTRATARMPGQQAVLAEIKSSIMAGNGCVRNLVCSSSSQGIFRNVIAVKPIMGVDGKPTHIVTLQKQARSEDDVNMLTSLFTAVLSNISGEEIEILITIP